MAIILMIVELNATKTIAATKTGFAASSMPVFVNPFVSTVATVDGDRYPKKTKRLL